MKGGDAETISWVENIITILVLERTRGVAEGVQNIVAEALWIKVIKGNTAEDIFSYTPTEEMMNVALINMRIGDRVQDAYNSRGRHECLSLRRLRYIQYKEQRGTLENTKNQET